MALSEGKLHFQEEIAILSYKTRIPTFAGVSSAVLSIATKLFN